MSDQKHKLSPITVSLHWIVAITIISLLAVGIYMSETHSFGLYDIHKSFGILIFAFVLVRIVWRLRQGWPVPVSNYSKLQQTLAKVTHWGLLLGTVIMPISGMLYSGLSGHGFSLFGLELVAQNYHPTIEYEIVPHNDILAELAEEIHGTIGYIMVILVVLHVVGALGHHFLDKDGTLKRMLGKSV
jgi:cytochrome b561